MAGNARFELKSASPDSGFAANYSNGQRAAYAGPTLDRSGSFSEGAGNRMFGYGKGTSRASGTLTGEIPPVSQCLMLEPILMGEPKYPRSVELRRVLGISVGSASEDNSFGAAHLKPSPSVSMDEVKRFKTNLADICTKASGRAKKFDDLLHRLNKYNEVTRKQQRNELLMNERSGASSLKMGTQIHRGPSELVTQKADDRPKNGTLNKRVRTSVAETRSEYRSNGMLRQTVLMTKERDMHKDSNADSDMAEEKVRRLPAGGEGWDKKMKRKRSVGVVISRPIDDDGELKRSMHHKLSSEAGLPSGDSHGFRSGMPSAAGNNSKSEGTSSPASSSSRALQNEQEKSTLSRDLTAGLNKEKFLAKGNIKLNSCEESNACPSPITKGKASRAPRSGSLVANNSSSNVPRVPGTLESWEQVPNAIKNLSVGGANNRKRPFPAGSSSPPITQWIVQRPQKISRTRRVNLVSPVSNNDEMQMPSDGCSPSDFGARSTTGTVNGSLLPKGVTGGAQNVKVKTESVLSPARLSESEESGAGEIRLKDKGTGCSEGEGKAAHAIQNVGPSTSHLKKNKFFVKEEIGDGVRRQGRSGRVSSFTRGNISPTMDKLDSLSTSKPLRPTRPAFEKNGSKSGRPLKKQSERKGFSRLGHPTSSGSPDFTGDSDDGREELLSAANSAYNSSVHACSSPFWKKVEAFFASISSEEKFYLSDQLQSAEELHAKLTQISYPENGVLGDHVQDEISVSDTLSGDLEKCMKNQSGSKDSANADLVDKVQDSISCAKLDSNKNFDKVTPLYQRVLSALIMEDDLEEFEENGFERSLSLQGPGDSPDEASPFIDSDSRNMDRTEFECESVVGVVQLEKNGTSNKFASCNGYGAYTSNTGVRDSPYSNEMLLKENGFVHSEIGLLVDLSRCNSDGPQNLLTSSFSISSLDCQYSQMSLNDRLLLELQSVGLYLEAVPDLEDKEDEMINQEIMQLERGLYQQIGRKKTYLCKISRAIQEGKDVDCWDPEQVAMNRLVELAYKKLLATRKASKLGLPKVSKQVALAFARRTLARCHKYEESGASCFTDPLYRDIIFAPPPRISEAELLAGSIRGSAGVLDPYDNHQSDQAFARNGPLLNRGKKKEVFLDDVGGAAFRATSTLGGTLFGGAKGKRSERDRDRDTSVRNANAKAGRSSLGNSKGDRKTKTKPKQKTAQLSTSGNGSYSKFLETTNPMHTSVGGSGELVNTNGNMKRECNIPSNSREVKESADVTNLPLNDIDPIGELGVESDIGATQDFNSWFNFDVDGLQDHDCVGLEIPMDDLSELNMF